MRFLAVVALLVLSVAGCWFATQYVASALSYASALGPPWATLGDERLYAPWQWIVWGRLFAPRAPIVFRNAGAMTSLAALAGAVASAMAALRPKPSASSRAHGSSRWATTAEMKRAGLLQGAGVVLCQTNDAEFRTTLDSAGRTRVTSSRLGALVRHDGPEHVFCFAPTRSGKGVGLVIPTLLSWPHSVLVYDIKKENWALTAGWRRQFSRTWRFEPTSIDSVRFNPLLEIRKGLSEVRDTQNVADILVDPTGEMPEIPAANHFGGRLLHQGMVCSTFKQPPIRLTRCWDFTPARVLPISPPSPITTMPTTARPEDSVK